MDHNTLPTPPSPPPSPGGETRHRAAGRSRGAWRDLLLPDPGLDLEARLFQSVSLLATVMALLVIVPFNYFQNLSPWLNVAVFVFGIVALWLWRESRRGRLLPVTMFVVFMAVLNATWFVNGGSQGSIVLYFFDAVLLPVIFCRGRVRALLIALLVANVVVLYWVDYRFPQWIIPFGTPFDRVVDSATGFAICAFVLVVAVGIVLRSYLDERARLVESNQRLQQSLEEVRTLRGLLPICSWCKKVRDDEGLWTQMEQYVTANTDATFTHGMCPECFERSRREIDQLLPVRPAGGPAE